MLGGIDVSFFAVRGVRERLASHRKSEVAKLSPAYSEAASDESGC